MTIRPIYSFDPQDGSEPVFMLSEEDYRKIANGYGCPKCLEDYNGIFLLECPFCKHAADFSDMKGLAPKEFALADPSLAYEPEESIDLKGY